MYESEWEAQEAYKDMLNEFAEEWETPARSAAENMKRDDHTMYRCGFNDWIDAEIDNGQAPKEAEDWSAED